MMKLKDIRKSYIRSYYNGIVRNGKMALNTLETIQNVLHQVFAVAVDDEYIRVNPTDGVLTAIKAAHQYETPKRHALTLPQQQAFLNFKTPKFQHWLPMFTFMLGTGCRISETVGLCWGDIGFESGFIIIQPEDHSGHHGTPGHQHHDGDLRGSHQGSQSPFLCKSERQIGHFGLKSTTPTTTPLLHQIAGKLWRVA